MPDLNQDDEILLISAPIAAKRLGICPRSLYTLTKHGEIPFCKIGRRTLYCPNDLKAYAHKKINSPKEKRS